MDFLKLDERIMELMDVEKFDAAEAELHQAKLQASNAADHQAPRPGSFVTRHAVQRQAAVRSVKGRNVLLGTRVCHRHGLRKGPARDDIVLGNG